MLQTAYVKNGHVKFVCRLSLNMFKGVEGSRMVSLIKESYASY